MTDDTGIREHDRMCLWWESKPDQTPAKDCVMCKLISNVRADERNQCVTKIERAHQGLDFLDLAHYHWCEYNNAHAALQRAVDVIHSVPLPSLTNSARLP